MKITENEAFLTEAWEPNNEYDDEVDSPLSNVAELISEAGDILELTSSQYDKNSRKIEMDANNNNNENCDDKNEKDVKDNGVGKYMSERMMTPLQEKLNAWTVVPNVIYCMYFIFSGNWLTEESIDMAQLDMMGYAHMQEEGDFRQWATDVNASNQFTLLNMFGLKEKCLFSSYFPNLNAFPPLPLLAIAIGITLHAPFSFLYHYNCALILPPDISRIEHWSRRMDHSMIHVASAFLSYGTTGRWDYFIINSIYNLDCVYRQFLPIVNPKLNKIRILISFVSYTIPVLKRGNFTTFMQLWFIIVISAWLFAKYPIKGWSHSAFHVVMSLLPHLLMVFACTLPSSQNQIRTAARCAVVHSSSR